MLSKIIAHGWSLRQQFIKYAVTGGSAFILDMGTLYLLKEYTSLRPYVAVVVNQPFILLYIFLLNKYWSFQAKGMTHRQMIRFLALAAFNYGFAAVWMWALNERLGFQYLVVRVCNIVFAVSWNFLLYKYWVYKETGNGLAALENG